MADTIIRIIVQESGSDKAGQNIKDVGDKADEAGGKLNGFQKALKAAFTISAISEAVHAFIEMSDTLTMLHNRIGLVTTSQQAAATAFHDIQGIAQVTGASLNDVGEAFARLSIATEGMGLSEKEVIGLTASLIQSFTILHGSADGAANTIRVLDQAFERGVINSKELRSLAGQNPAILNALAGALGKSTEELTRMAAQGKLSAQAIATAFAEIGPLISAQFEKASPTIKTELGRITASIQTAFDKLGNTGVVQGLLRSFNNGVRTISGQDSVEQEQFNLDITQLHTAQMAQINQARNPVAITTEQQKYLDKLSETQAKEVDIANTRALSTASQAAAVKVEDDLRQHQIISESKFNDMLAAGVPLFKINTEYGAKLNDTAYNSYVNAAKNVEFLKVANQVQKELGGSQADYDEKLKAADFLLDSHQKSLSQILEYQKKIAAASLASSPDLGPALARGKELIELIQQDSRPVADSMVTSWNEAGGAALKYQQTVQAITENVKNGALTQVQSINQIRDAQIALLDKQTDVASGFERGYLKMQKDAQDFASQSEKLVTDSFKGMEDAVVKFTHTGKLSFADLANSILDDLTRIIFKQITAGLMSSIGGAFGGGGGLGSLFGGAASSGGAALGGSVTHVTNLAGAFADGGTAQAGRPYLVGEKGPEIFTPGQTGQVHPNGAMSGPTIINTIDPKDIIGLLNTKDGQDAIVNVIKLNKTATKAGLGIG